MIDWINKQAESRLRGLPVQRPPSGYPEAMMNNPEAIQALD